MAKTEKPQVSANPLEVEWPQDQYRITQKFKAEGLRLASRVNDQRDKLEVALATLAVLREHMIAKYKKSVDMQKEKLDAAKKKREEAALAADAARDRRIAALEAELANLKPTEDDKEDDKEAE